MKAAFEDVRREVTNLEYFVQERIKGMKIVQLFTREEEEFDTFDEINKKHKRAWIKTVWYNSIYFPIAELSASVALGLVVWYGGLNALGGGVVTLGIITAFIDLTQILFRPLRQLADKFNTLQMGMVAANRIFVIFNTKASSPNTCTTVY